MSDVASQVRLPDCVRELFPYTSRFFSVGKYKLHYIDEGSGPVLLLLHACPLWAFSFREIIRVFSPTHRVIALDQMGFGLSDKSPDLDYRIQVHSDHLALFIRKLDLKDITLIMHGRGSVIGMTYATKYSENIRAVISMNTMGLTDFELPWRLQLCRIPWLGEKLFFLLNLFNKDLKRYSAAVREAYLFPFRDRLDKTPLLKFVMDIPCHPEDNSALDMMDMETWLWTLREKPIAIIWAKKDWLYTMRCFRTWTKYFPDAEVHMIEDAGRYLLEDAPDKLIPIFQDFLERNKC